ncbi:MAG: cytidylyltransferase domain-containing protein [Lachnospiraceae bacterium]
MKYLAIIQARCGSSRLPSKVLKDLCGKTALQRVVERVQQSKYVDEVMVATTLNKEDIPIVQLCSGLGVRVFAGNALDVLDRYYQAAKLIKPEYVIRITADCPVFDATLLDDAIEKMAPESEYMAAMTETLADGLDLEIIKFDSLKRAWNEAQLASEREHVTMYIKNNKDKFVTQNYESPIGNLHDERWTIDEPEDYEFIKNIYDYFYKQNKEIFWSREILAYLNSNSSVRDINKGFIRNEGLLISQRNDRIVKRPKDE